MTTRAKFTVLSITRTLGSRHVGDNKYVLCEQQTVKLIPVTDGTPEDKQFWMSTPCGSIELGIVNPEAVKAFELGKKMYVDFTPAD